MGRFGKHELKLHATEDFKNGKVAKLNFQNSFEKAIVLHRLSDRGLSTYPLCDLFGLFFNPGHVYVL